MSCHDRRAAARRRAWGRGPMILRFEPLEGRALLATTSLNTLPLPELADTSFTVTPNADWNEPVQVTGAIKNSGTGAVPPGAIAAIYASPTLQIGPGSVLVGTVPITAGLAPGATQTYSQQVNLPPSPLPGMGTNSKFLYLGVRIDPGSIIAQTSTQGNEGIGLGIDQGIVTITPDKPANLIGKSFAISAATSTWGSTINLSAQIQNNADGNAPATRAKIVLTPNGITPGGFNDITVGSIQIPAIPAFQTINVTGSITLPQYSPTLLAGQGYFLMSMIQDADHQASPLVQTTTVRGIGQDQAVIGIANPPTVQTPQPALPDLAANGVVTPNASLYWGESFQVSTSVQNIGQGDSGSFPVEFVLTGPNGAMNQSIYLGSAQVTGLKAGYTQNIIQNIQLPSRLPFGLNVAASTIGRIVAIVNPEYGLNETNFNNNVAQSAPVTLKLLGSTGVSTVPSSPPLKSTQPVATTTTTTVTYPVVPKKKGSYHIPAKHHVNVLKDIQNYPNTAWKFFKNVITPPKAKPKPKKK